MKRFMAVLGTVALIAGCGSKHEASTGKEWVEQMTTAAKEKDTDTIWKMMSKKSQENAIKEAGELKEQMKESSAAESKTFAKQLNMDENTDFGKISDEDIAKNMLAVFSKEMAKFTFVSEEADGDNVKVKVKNGDNEITIRLVKEDGYLKGDN